MSNKVLQISAEDAKYIDPTQIASLQLVDGSMIYVKGNEQEGEFVEEAQDEQQYQAQEVQNQQGQKLRGRGVLGALAGIAAGTALLGTAAALGTGMRRPYYGRPMMGPPMVPPPPPPMMGPPMMRPPMMGPMHRGPMMGRRW